MAHESDDDLKTLLRMYLSMELDRSIWIRMLQLLSREDLVRLSALHRTMLREEEAAHPPEPSEPTRGAGAGGEC